jgi:hypothetical protein
VIDVLTRQLEHWQAAGATHVSVSGLNAGRSPSEHIALVEEAARALVPLVSA